jgi:cytochrome b561
MTETTHQFGWVAIITHWIIALAVFGLFGLGYWMVDLGYYDSWYVAAPNLHKSVGLCLLVVMIFSVIWRLTHARADPLPTHTHLEQILSRAMHFSLTLMIFLVIVSGYLISTSQGVGIEVFELFEVPGFGSFVEDQEHNAGLIHKYAAFIVTALALFHIMAALKHHIIDKDETLTRMLVRKRKAATTTS